MQWEMLRRRIRNRMVSDCVMWGYPSVVAMFESRLPCHTLQVEGFIENAVLTAYQRRPPGSRTPPLHGSYKR